MYQHEDVVQFACAPLEPLPLELEKCMVVLPFALNSLFYLSQNDTYNDIEMLCSGSICTTMHVQ